MCLSICKSVLAVDEEHDEKIYQLKIYPYVFKFNNGETVIYYKQLGTGELAHAHINGLKVR